MRFVDNDCLEVFLSIMRNPILLHQSLPGGNDTVEVSAGESYYTS
jgi:hypothetical protein